MLAGILPLLGNLPFSFASFECPGMDILGCNTVLDILCYTVLASYLSIYLSSVRTAACIVFRGPSFINILFV